MTDLQTISAGQGVATFVPAGRVIKITHNQELQSIDLWAFVLSKPEVRDQGDSGKKQFPASVSNIASKKAPIKKKSNGSDLPSQKDAEDAMNKNFEFANNQPSPAKRSTWASYVPTSYVPSLGFGKKKEEQDTVTTDKVEGETEQHRRDPSKPYYEQLRVFSNTPVGAASLSVLTGTGYAASLNAGHTAWSTLKKNQSEAGPTMEYLSMSHTRGATCHLTPQTHDLLSSNLGEPVLTLLENTSANGHDSLTAACMPAMESTEEMTPAVRNEASSEKRAANMGQGAEQDGQHTCAENLVLALGELNTHAKLPGAQAIGAAITVHNLPPPLRLFRGIAVDAKSGALRTKPSTSGVEQDEAFVRLRAERDLVIVMSACVEGRSESQPSEHNKIEAHFFVEEPQEFATKQRERESKIQKPPATTKKSAAALKAAQSSSKASPTAAPPTTGSDTAKTSKTMPPTSSADASKPSRTKSQTGPAKLAAVRGKPKVNKTGKLESSGETKESSNKQTVQGNGTESNVQQNGNAESTSPDAKKERKKPRKLVRKEA